MTKIITKTAKRTPTESPLILKISFTSVKFSKFLKKSALNSNEHSQRLKCTTQIRIKKFLKKIERKEINLNWSHMDDDVIKLWTHAGKYYVCCASNTQVFMYSLSFIQIFCEDSLECVFLDHANIWLIFFSRLTTKKTMFLGFLATLPYKYWKMNFQNSNYAAWLKIP